jgi:predicted lactoylglutathione lyase
MAVADPHKIFVNLPVKDLDKTVDFWTRLGFEFNPQFTDEKGACMVLSEGAFVMLLVEDFFRTFTTKDVCDAGTQAEVILALSAGSREQVDELVGNALLAGGRPARETKDHGFMYEGSFHDLDGHLWEAFWMDESTVRK